MGELWVAAGRSGAVSLFKRGVKEKKKKKTSGP